MKSNTLFLTILLGCINFLAAQDKSKEVFIMGTMHTVPKIVKNSYKPLLTYAIKYKPEAIYAERVRPNDTISLHYYYKKFVRKSDSVKKSFTPNKQRFKSLHEKGIVGFTKEDYEFIITSYLVKKDYANYYHYTYLKKYGVKGSKKPLRNENADLTSQLAIALQIQHIHAMDDQQTNAAYHKAWRKCAESGVLNGDNEINRKLNKKDYNSAVIPAIFGNLGKHTNKLKSLNRMHLLNSFRYVQNRNTDCQNATKYWDERNFRMARNIAEQVIEKEHKKNIVIVGAGHVIGLKEALEKNYPELKVQLMYED